MGMNSRERVQAALSHREPDRVPVDLGSTCVTSITSGACGPLRAYLGLPVDEAPIWDLPQQLPYLGEDLLVRLGVDTRPVTLPRANALPEPLIDEGAYWGWINRWGARLRMPKEGGFYFDWVEFPMRDLTEEAVRTFRWPELDSPEVLALVREEAVRLHETTDYALVGAGIVGMGIFEQGCFTVGSEEFMMAMAADRPLAERLLDGITEFSIESANRYLDQVGELLDVYQYGDDVSTQLGWMISPEAYVSLIKPRQKRLFDAIRAKTSAKLFYHGCGAVFDLIPHLIDIGVDVVNPVQVSARGMDTARLKATYGRDVVFWGGGVDTQQVLPFGTRDQVRAEVWHRVRDLGPDGFVWAAVHNVQSGVPPENVVAAFDAVRELAG
ncbi:MAG TPA: uroporphyrinogen decarboxylase family protein [Candidatus Limnocylindrales bacterium]